MSGPEGGGSGAEVVAVAVLVTVFMFVQGLFVREKNRGFELPTVTNGYQRLPKRVGNRGVAGGEKADNHRAGAAGV